VIEKELDKRRLIAIQGQCEEVMQFNVLVEEKHETLAWGAERSLPASYFPILLVLHDVVLCDIDTVPFQS
jgi:hypothetical protein